nr:ATP-binding protein [Halosaccharopolyspora lacisalsi]
MPESGRLRRRRSGRVLAGVSGGVAEHLGASVFWVRAVFVVLAALGGSGILAYGLLWMFVPQSSGNEPEPTPKERQQGFGMLVLGVGLAVTITSVGTGAVWFVGPLGVVLVGAAVVWREADESQRGRWRQGARIGVAEVMVGGGGRAAVLRIVIGVGLAVVGLGLFLGGNATLDEMRFALLAVLTTLVGVAVLTVPWWVRLVRDLNVERAGRIRSQERAEIASHLHDSVLQTLALIQKQSGDSREVWRLARGQERELRHWLYGSQGHGRSDDERGDGAATSSRTLSEELGRVCGEVEDTFAITAQHVVVSDCDVDEPIAAMLAAAREALVNAAKHAGVDEVSVYGEVTDDAVEVFVRDRGAGFDPERVAVDRHGLADSIRGRMERNGGSARVRTAPGAGTEIQLAVPRH